jgi:hypothetical protein
VTTKSTEGKDQRFNHVRSLDNSHLSNLKFAVSSFAYRPLFSIDPRSRATANVREKRIPKQLCRAGSIVWVQVQHPLHQAQEFSANARVLRVQADLPSPRSRFVLQEDCPPSRGVLVSQGGRVTREGQPNQPIENTGPRQTIETYSSPLRRTRQSGGQVAGKSAMQADLGF